MVRLWIRFHATIRCHHRTPWCSRAACCALALAVRGLLLKEKIVDMLIVLPFPFLQVASAQNTEAPVIGVIPRLGHAMAPWSSTERPVADVPMQIEDDPRDQSYGSLVATSPMSLVSTTTGSSNQDNSNTSQLS